MCGISGIFSFDSDFVIDSELLKSMNNAQAHRGPNGQGYHIKPGIGLGHRRLSVIDLAGGHQPLYNADKSVVVVFNGEIFNHHDLAKELTALGYNFQTHSDTETIVHAWQEWGVDCVHHFRGMFAFILWDSIKKELFVARDRLGVKPLHYSLLSNGSVIFGSELKVLRQHPLCPNTINPESIEDYLTFGYIPDPKTIFSDVFKLEAGYYLHLKQNENSKELIPIQYWDLPWQANETLSSQEIEEELIERLKEAVEIRMEAEVPLGAFLSGGVDSGAIVAMMSQLQSTPVNTCSIGFDVPEFNETDFAKLVADRYQTNHNVEMVNHEDFDLIDKLIDIYDEPYADSSALPTYRVCELARKHVTVALSGDGGDELFAGYRRYRLHMAEQALRDKIPLSIRKPIFSVLGKLYPKLDWAPQFLRAKTTFQSLALSSSEAYLNSMSKLRVDERENLYSKRFLDKLNGYNSGEVFKRLLKGKSFDDPLKEVQYLDYKTWITGDINTKVDRASMAHGLEVRVPFLDHQFIEWAFKVPSSANLYKGEGKAALKKQLESHVPHDNLYRKKMGFSVPLAEWLRGPLKDKLRSLITSEAFMATGIFQSEKINIMLEDHLANKKNHADSLWTLMMLGLFIERESAK
ncbi:asparagine synthetase B [Colwellia sp. MT41]|uniref:XrtA/PEP-CTERM system amidotransferase n=1 Tax=Colwellia sp. MT41 TaxID=58049 RepID=UPI0007175F8A|nr:XrtA/PEP-CTERM system amidotransferase [Colwellia sp. MT41]ALO36464.1 asparagine synthetase B [Colwellia sp. MT41]